MNASLIGSDEADFVVEIFEISDWILVRLGF